MKHTIILSIKRTTKKVYQILMVVGLVFLVVGLGLSMIEIPLIFLSILGLLIFLITYFTVKEVNGEEIKLVVESSGDQLTIYRENNRGYQTRKTIINASELSSMKIIVLKGAWGMKYYSIEAKTKDKGPLSHKIIRLLSPVLEANENEILNILNVIQKQYPFIQIGH